MIKKYSFLLNTVIIVMMAAAIVISPYLFFEWQEKKLFRTEVDLSMEPFSIGKIEHIQLNLEDRRTMILENNTDIERIELKTGNKYSLYEARKQCFKELCKLPILEMDVYGPIQKEINLTPSLVVNSRTPAYSMIVWRGSLKIKDVPYQIVLDEESGKLLSIQIADDFDSDDKHLQEALQEQWEEYFYNQ
jgi:hypothetical protein